MPAPKGYRVLPNGQKEWFGGGLLDVLNETTAAEAGAIAEQLAKITRSKSGEKYPLNIGLPTQE